MAEFVIRTDIPLPTQVRGRPNKYRWKDVPVGGSFFIPGVKSRPSTQVGQIAIPGSTWTTAPRTEDGVAGYRIFRTA